MTHDWVTALELIAPSFLIGMLVAQRFADERLKFYVDEFWRMEKVIQEQTAVLKEAETVIRDWKIK
jgi:hypothetical protein